MIHVLRTGVVSTLLLAVLAIGGCKKINGIDNNSVITKPYALYFSDTLGMLMHTTDGKMYSNIFPPDGVPMRSILVNTNNIIFIKGNLHLSDDNGKNFNPKFVNVSPFAFVQPMLYEVKSHNRIYVASTASGSVSFSSDSGKTWVTDAAWDPNITARPNAVSSFAQLNNGVLFTYDPLVNKLYRRNDASAEWKEITMVNGLLPAAYWYLTKINNTLIAADYAGGNGVYFSNDEGVNWTAYPGLSGMNVLSCYAPYDRVLMAGTKDNGVFVLQNGTFVPFNNGLANGTSVKGITGKFNLYKNNDDIRTVYIATTDGLYRTEDYGRNWILAKPGSISALY